MVERHRAKERIVDHAVRWKPEWWHRADLPLLRHGIDSVIAISEPDVDPAGCGYVDAMS